jgi:hypothetical protein
MRVLLKTRAEAAKVRRLFDDLAAEDPHPGALQQPNLDAGLKQERDRARDGAGEDELVFIPLGALGALQRPSFAGKYSVARCHCCAPSPAW